MDFFPQFLGPTYYWIQFDRSAKLGKKNNKSQLLFLFLTNVETNIIIRTEEIDEFISVIL